MSGVSIWHWFIILLLILLIALPGMMGFKIARRAGISGVWGAMFGLPLIGIVAMWMVALKDWPNVTRRPDSGGLRDL
jgi:hypothetical protein